MLSGLIAMPLLPFVLVLLMVVLVLVHVASETNTDEKAARFKGK